MAKDSVTTIVLPVFDSGGRAAGHEELSVVLVGGTTYRLQHSPSLVEGLAAGDLIQLTDQNRDGFLLLERSGNLCIWFYAAEEQSPESPTVAHLAPQLATLGGWLDGGLGKLLIWSVPIHAGFSRIEHIFDDTVRRYPGSTWLYGNVYDPQDGAPLNWWNE